MIKTLSYLYSTKFSKELKKKKGAVKESYIMKIVSTGTRDVLKFLKKNNKAIQNARNKS